MNYELAKQLKEMGFPQSGTTFLPDPNCPNLSSNQPAGHTDNCSVYPPTLSELIAELGNSLVLKVYKEKCSAFTCDHDDLTPYEAHGSNPEEAVAKLWLALNKGV